MFNLFAKFIRFFYKPDRIEGKHKKTCNMYKSPEDLRDVYYSIKRWFADTFVYLDSCSLEEYAPPMKHQGYVGSCGSHAIATAFEILLKRDKKEWYHELSERFHYYLVRDIDYMDTFPADSGQYLRMGLKAAQKVGVCPETLCPYDYKKYNDKPTKLAYSFARWWRLKVYRRIYSLKDVKKSIILGFPVVFGMTVYKSFKSLRNDYYCGPCSSTDKKSGGHAMVVVGYDDARHAFRVINSWGTNWADKGYVWLDYNCFKKYLLDAWAVDV